jgi:hypothetical protein
MTDIDDRLDALLAGPLKAVADATAPPADPLRHLPSWRRRTRRRRSAVLVATAAGVTAAIAAPLALLGGQPMPAAGRPAAGHGAGPAGPPASRVPDPCHDTTDPEVYGSDQPIRLGWPSRGNLRNDRDFVTAAERAWATQPCGQNGDGVNLAPADPVRPPFGSPHVLLALSRPGGRAAVVEAVDGKPVGFVAILVQQGNSFRILYRATPGGSTPSVDGSPTPQLSFGFGLGREQVLLVNPIVTTVSVLDGDSYRPVELHDGVAILPAHATTRHRVFRFYAGSRLLDEGVPVPAVGFPATG